MARVHHILLVTAVLAVAAPAIAADPLPPELARVPRDAALFVRVDFAALWKSKLGDSVRAVPANELDAVLKTAQDYSGLTLEDVKTVTLFMPQLKGPGDERTVAFSVGVRKPIDRARLVAGMSLNKIKYIEKPTDVFTLDGPRAGAKDDPNNKVVVVLTDPKRVDVFLGATAKFRDPRPAGETGPQDAALAAAATGTTGVLGINFASFPDEIRGDDVPSEIRPFQPLFRSDTLVATARLADARLNFEVRFRNKDKAKTLDAEKSLAAGVALMQLALGAGIQELEKMKAKRPEANEIKFIPLAQATVEALKTAKVTVQDTDAVATMSAPIDLPVGPLLLEAFGGASSPRSAAARANTQNNLKQIGLALHNYHAGHNTFPPSAILGKKGKPMLSWRVTILPYIEQNNLYTKFKLDEPWDSAHNKKVFDENPMPPVFRLVGVTKDGDKVTHFQVFTGRGAMFDPVLGTKIAAITDGTSNTLMVATAAKAVPWTAPDDVVFDPKADPKTALLFPDDKGTNVLYADGSVRIIAPTVDADTLRAIITRSGGEVIGDVP